MVQRVEELDKLTQMLDIKHRGRFQAGGWAGGIGGWQRKESPVGEPTVLFIPD